MLAVLQLGAVAVSKPSIDMYEWVCVSEKEKESAFLFYTDQDIDIHSAKPE